MYPKRQRGRERESEAVMSLCDEDGVRTQCVCVLINLFPGWEELKRDDEI